MIALQPDGSIFIGGGFTTVKGVVRPHVARLYGAEVGPGLNIVRLGGLVTVSWPRATGFLLERSLAPTDGWSQIPFPYVTNADTISVSAPVATGNCFYRLRKQ